jgi:hypothetical protein
LHNDKEKPHFYKIHVQGIILGSLNNANFILILHNNDQFHKMRNIPVEPCLANQDSKSHSLEMPG